MKFATLLLATTLVCSPCYAAMTVADAEKAVLDKLSDPDSAKFRNVKLYPHHKDRDGNISPIICGEVNAKNQMGGYAGYSQFMFTPEGNAILLSEYSSIQSINCD